MQARLGSPTPVSRSRPIPPCRFLRILFHVLIILYSQEQQKERERELALAAKGATAKKKTSSRRKVHPPPNKSKPATPARHNRQRASASSRTETPLSHERDNQSDDDDEREDYPHEDEPMNEVSQQEQMALRGQLYMDQSALAAYQAMLSAQHSAWYAYQHGQGSSATEATEGAYDTAHEMESSEVDAVDAEQGQDQDAEGESEIDPYEYDAAGSGGDQWAQPHVPGAGWTQHASPWANDAAWIEGVMQHGTAHTGIGNPQHNQSFAPMPQSQPTFHVWPGVGNFVYQPFDPHAAQNGSTVPHQFEYNVAHDPQSIQETRGSGSGAGESAETTATTTEGMDDPLELAAESLLDLHSTPLAPSPTKSSRTPLEPLSRKEHQGLLALSQPDGSPELLQPQSQLPLHSTTSATREHVPAPAPAWPLLEAPEIGIGTGTGSGSGSRPRPQRARSLLQPFPPSRTGLGARSLSFWGLDDPFAFPSVDPTLNKGTLEKVTEGHADPTSSDKDLTDSRTERTTTSSPILEPQGQVRKPLVGLKPNLDFAVTPFKLGAFTMASGVSQPTPFHSAITPAFSTGQFTSTPLHHDLPSSGILATPLSRRPFNHSTGTGTGTGNGTGAGAAGRGWLLSSPANAEAAAALGLQAHAWYPETPGFVGVVMAETPVRSLKRSKSKAVALVREDGDE